MKKKEQQQKQNKNKNKKRPKSYKSDSCGSALGYALRTVGKNVTYALGYALRNVQHFCRWVCAGVCAPRRPAKTKSHVYPF